MITAERLHEVLGYDPVTGLFTWKQRTSKRMRIGDRAGTVSKGHLRIRVDGQLYAAHRLAWFYMTNNWPVNEIDHRDTIKLNNVWDNLREATPSQNRCNRPAQRNSKTGVKGVWWHRSTGKWRSAIRINGQVQHLGLFQTIDEAADAYRVAANDLHQEFARTA